MKRWKHLKRGAVATELGRTSLTLRTPLSDNAALIVYWRPDGTLAVAPMTPTLGAALDNDGAKARLQTAAPFKGGEVVIYRDGSRLWVRPTAEFEDGRFERLLEPWEEEYPRPWRVEEDWTAEIYAANGKRIPALFVYPRDLWLARLLVEKVNEGE